MVSISMYMDTEYTPFTISIFASLPQTKPANRSLLRLRVWGWLIRLWSAEGFCQMVASKFETCKIHLWLPPYVLLMFISMRGSKWMLFSTPSAACNPDSPPVIPGCILIFLYFFFSSVLFKLWILARWQVHVQQDCAARHKLLHGNNDNTKIVLRNGQLREKVCETVG